MVDQSELPWRVLSRRHGAQLCYTPMYHASVFLREPSYRKAALASCEEDRPLIIQFCANDPEIFLKAALLAEPYCDAIDLNLGCPQHIARRGHYGAFLQDEWDLLNKIVNLAAEKLSVPITCKIRVFEDIDKTVEYAKMLEKAGCQLLTVHGRTRDQKKELSGLASWDHIKAVKENLSIPVFANGNIQYFNDVHRCIEYTGVDGVMTAEGNLYNPALFSGNEPYVWEMGEQYLDLVDHFPCALSAVRGHLFKLWHHGLSIHTDIRERLSKAGSLNEMKGINNDLKKASKNDEIKTHESVDPDKKPYWICQPYIRSKADKNLKNEESKDDKNSLSKKQMKKILKKQQKQLKKPAEGSFKWDRCKKCKVNPKGRKCVYTLCRTCCREKTFTEQVNCASHRFRCDRKPETNKVAGLELTVMDSNDDKMEECPIINKSDSVK